MRMWIFAIALCLAASRAAAQAVSPVPFAPPPDFGAGPARIDLSKSRDLDNWLAVQIELQRRKDGRQPDSPDAVETYVLQRLDTNYSLKWFPRARERATYFGTCTARLDQDDCVVCEIRPNIILEVPDGSVAEGYEYRFETTRSADFSFHPEGLMVVGGYVVMERVR